MNIFTIARAAGILLVIEGLLLFAPAAILGSAINWPASLSEPPSVVLPLIQQQAGAVQLGYTIYLLYSVLFWPVALLTARAVAGGDSLPPLLKLAVGFGIASTVARTLGILRWLVAMPGLAAIYNAPGVSETTRTTVEITYQTLNSYAGGVGEVLGVGLFAALWLGSLAIATLRSGALPRWLGLFGLLATAALLGGLVELFGVDLGALITVSTSLIQLWFLAAGLVLLSRRSAPMPIAARA
jgi:Domain of unknown function (DUF4386)